MGQLGAQMDQLGAQRGYLGDKRVHLWAPKSNSLSPELATMTLSPNWPGVGFFEAQTGPSEPPIGQSEPWAPIWPLWAQAGMCRKKWAKLELRGAKLDPNGPIRGSDVPFRGSDAPFRSSRGPTQCSREPTQRSRGHSGKKLDRKIGLFEPCWPFRATSWPLWARNFDWSLYFWFDEVVTVF